MVAQRFDYDEAFYVNSGVLSQTEQEKLRKARITIVGVGGAGGAIAIMLARSGIGSFNLIDFDTYSISNINRQIGCFLDTIGKFKVDVIKSEILRINPEADINAIPRKLSLPELGELLEKSDVYFSEADDLAYSTHSILLAQKMRKMAISFMPSGMTGYVMVFPPDLKRVLDPTDMMGGPAGLDYDSLSGFQRDEVCRKGRRWHITEGKMRVAWFRKWCAGEATLTQLCPSVWAGASLASVEAVKYITGKWRKVCAPNMWHMELADNRIQARVFRRRTWIFSKYIYEAMSIKKFGIGEAIQNSTLKSMEKDLARMEKQEAQGKTPRLPFIWRYII
jgi:molybdopterin/thiamine biosynthesis adenylyltransferase